MTFYNIPCYISFLCILINCAGRDSILIKDSPCPDSLVVVIGQVPQLSPLPGGISVPAYPFLSFMDKKTGFPVCLSRYEINDTITLATIHGYLEIGLRYRGIQIDYFYLKGGRYRGIFV